MILRSPSRRKTEYLAMVKNKNRILIGGLSLAILLVGAFLTLMVSQQRRREEINHLFKAGMSVAPMADKVNQLATYEESAPRLEEIARNSGAADENRLAAIGALSKRPGNGEFLASLLRHQEPISIMQGVSAALLESACRTGCLIQVAKYLDGSLEGKLTADDTRRLERLPPGPMREEVKAFLIENRSEISATLQGVLKKADPSEVMNLLHGVYGLGSNRPSRFGLSLVVVMRFREACSLIDESLNNKSVLKPEDLEDLTRLRGKLCL